MVDACAMNGILPFYGPFGDIKDVVACEDQFRNAYLLGCVGAWSLHPAQITVAKKVFSPDPADVAHARRVVEAMGDGTGAVSYTHLDVYKRQVQHRTAPDDRLLAGDEHADGDDLHVMGDRGKDHVVDLRRRRGHAEHPRPREAVVVGVAHPDP